MFTHEARADADQRQAHGQSDSSWASLKPASSLSLDSDDLMDFGANLTRAETLAEHLIDQLHMETMSETDRLIPGKWWQWQNAAYWAVRGLVVVGGAVLGYVAEQHFLNWPPSIC